MVKKIAAILLLTGVALCLLQVWLPHYYLTGDGPGHVYNAQVLHDLWAGKNVAFYSRFYRLVYQPNPNWLSTAAIAALMFLVNGIVAEKIFLTVYIVLYVSGFYLLLKKISDNDSTFLLLVILVFVFPQTLAKGFYNFSFSIAFYFWVVWGWLRFLERRTLGNALLFFLFTTLIFFTHLLSFVFAAFTCAALAASYAIAEAREKNSQKSFVFFFKNAAFLAIILLPFLVLMNWFTHKEGGMRIQLAPHLYRLIELMEGKYLVNVTHTEDFPAEFAGIIIMVLLSCSFIGIKNRLKISKYDGFLVSLVFVVLVYLCFPESFLGRLILISTRVQIFVYLLMVCCIACRPVADKLSISSAFIISFIFLALGTVETAGFLTARAGTLDDIYSVAQRIYFSEGILLTVFILIFCAVLFKLPFIKIRNVGFILSFACFVVLTCVRLCCLLNASSAVVDYTSAKQYIKPYSVVLPMDFAPNGKDKNDKMIADRNWLFYHASQYMGIKKPMIILDNYEANMGYFPLRWTDSTNPYFHLSKGEGIEAQPPYANIEEYKQTTGVNIDYILMWCFDSSYLNNEHFRKLYAEINAGYHVAYTSTTRRTVLFEQNH